MGDPSEWQSFYVMAGGAGAVLTGLIFVAITFHAAPILTNTIHRDRAWASMGILASQLFISMAVLVPDQRLPVLGAEVLVFGVLWAGRTVRMTRFLAPEMRVMDRPYADWRVEWVAWLGWVVALLAAGCALLADSGEAGMALLAVAMAGMFGFALWSAWVLIAEVSD